MKRTYRGVPNKWNPHKKRAKTPVPHKTSLMGEFLVGDQGCKKCSYIHRLYISKFFESNMICVSLLKLFQHYVCLIMPIAIFCNPFFPHCAAIVSSVFLGGLHPLSAFGLR